MRQAAFAAIAGASQGTVSRWENGESFPNLDQLRRIREAAVADGLAWNDALFFDASVPLPTPPDSAADAEPAEAGCNNP